MKQKAKPKQNVQQKSTINKKSSGKQAKGNTKAK